MSLWEREVVGEVLVAPHEQQLPPRTNDLGGRTVPLLSFRFQLCDGPLWTVTYAGETEGAIYQGDLLVVRGFLRGPGVLRATEIWLRARRDDRGDRVETNPPIRIAQKGVCPIATVLFGPESVEVKRLTIFRDERLKSNVIGRAIVRAYYHLGPWFATAVLQERPRLQRCCRVVLTAFVRALGAKEGGRERVVQ